MYSAHVQGREVIILLYMIQGIFFATLSREGFGKGSNFELSFYFSVVLNDAIT